MSKSYLVSYCKTCSHYKVCRFVKDYEQLKNKLKGQVKDERFEVSVECNYYHIIT